MSGPRRLPSMAMDKTNKPLRRRNRRSGCFISRQLSCPARRHFLRARNESVLIRVIRPIRSQSCALSSANPVGRCPPERARCRRIRQMPHEGCVLAIPVRASADRLTGGFMRFRPRLLVILAFVFIAPLTSLAAQQAAAQRFDLLITGGQVYDGSGNPWFYA